MVFKKGNVSWNKGLKGVMKAWNKGKKCSQISRVLKGKKRPDLIKRNKERAKEKIRIICKCGKEFFVNHARAKNGAEYCSQKCYHRFTNHNHTKGKRWRLSKETRIKQGLHQIGEKNHQWNGGYFRGKYLGIPQSKEFAIKVFKRDKYICQICGNTGRKAKLNAHHLNSVDKYPKEVSNINNGVTLCQKCHRRFHKEYGYGKNNERQFEEFITEKIESIKEIELNKSVIYNISLEGDSSFYANGILTHNTPPHIIKPSSKKALKFKAKGDKKFIFAKVVKHPGTRPMPFIRTAIYTKLAKIIKEEIMRIA